MVNMMIRSSPWKWFSGELIQHGQKTSLNREKIMDPIELRKYSLLITRYLRIFTQRAIC